MANSGVTPQHFPVQQQDANPGAEHVMDPPPTYDTPDYRGSDKLKNRVAIVTGGDSGIGRSVCIFFAREGADIVIVYLKNHKDAEDTKALVEKEGRKCMIMAGDVGDSKFCKQIVDQTVQRFGRLDILVNNAGYQHNADDITTIKDEDLEYVFRTNIFSMFYLSREATKHMKPGSSIINTTSVVSYKGKPDMLDYASSKGAITSFTRSLALQLVKKGIRVNGVAPGPIWTPFIPASMKPEDVKDFGTKTPMGRAGQPFECAPAYVYLASNDSSYVVGQIMHVNGGYVVNG